MRIKETVGTVAGTVAAVVSGTAEALEEGFCTFRLWYSIAFCHRLFSRVSLMADTSFSQQIRDFSGLLPSKTVFLEIW